jgi:hypothetical protein
MIATGIWEFNLGLMLIWYEILKPMFSSRSFLRLALLLLLVVTISYAQALGTTKSGPLAVEPGVIHFEDVARQAELNFLNVSGGTVHKEFIIETTGNGARPPRDLDLHLSKIKELDMRKGRATKWRG